MCMTGCVRGFLTQCCEVFNGVFAAGCFFAEIDLRRQVGQPDVDRVIGVLGGVVLQERAFCYQLFSNKGSRFVSTMR